MKPSRRFIIILCLFTLVFFSYGDEGMWLPHQMKMLNLKTLGLQMNPDDLYKPDGTGLMSAVVNLGGGTGEFVSLEGLILTNHHVAFSAIQRISTKEKDYLQNGFLAMRQADEIPAPGQTVDVLLGYEDVTAKIGAGIKTGMTLKERFDAVDKAEKEVIAEAEKAGKDLRCSVASMYSGIQYFLFRFKRIKDVRIVFAPPLDFGNFGGEVDNWMWPRHTCDFTFFRAYVAKDGTGADYSPENVPYKPRAILKISLEGVKEGDFTFVMGYPGRTYRNYSLSEVKLEKDIISRRIALYKEIIDFYEKAGRGNREIEIKYANKLRGLYNYLKNYQAKLEGMDKYAFFPNKGEAEKALASWIGADLERKKAYGDILSRMSGFMEKYAAYYWKNDFLTGLTSGPAASAILAQGFQIFRTVDERQKPDKEREAAYQDRNLSSIKQGIQLAERGYDLASDKAYLKHQLKKLMKMPEAQIPAAFKNLIARKSEQAVDDYVENLYAKTVLANPEKRLQMVEMNMKDAAALKDPVLELAADLEKELKVLREEGKTMGQERTDLKKAYEKALLEQAGGRLAPDANSTIRFTYGPVRGYSGKDAVYYLPQTTLKGVMEKETGEFPFVVPPKLKELYKKRDFGRYKDKKLDDIACCFLNTTNVTGGNSGSPALNARGEQIGIIFDMTYESVLGDYYVMPEFQRSISVDIRYILFVTEKFAGAAHIIKEMGL